MAGYHGKLLEVNLTEQRMRDVPLAARMCRDFIGGGGLAARLLLDCLDPGRDPLDPDSPLLIMTGPLTASRIIGAATRFTVAGRSPQTGFWGESSCGGSFGVMLKRNGWDGLIITGAAPVPVYLDLLDGACAIRDAADLWGLDTYETTATLKARIKTVSGKSASVFSIGPAGENLVRFACVMNDGHNAAGRCGFGALMGSKKLKALAAWGMQKPVFADPAALDALRGQLKLKIEESIAVSSMSAFGTAGGMDLGSMSGDIPIKNWTLGEWDEGIEQINGPTLSDTLLTKTASCFGCIVGCKRVVRVDQGPYAMAEGPGPEFETVAEFGAMILIGDLKPIARANDICNRMGMDTISCGGTLAWLIEAMERGDVTPEQTGGVRLDWGDADAVLAALDLIAHRRGIGDILALGSCGAAQALGAGGEYTVAVRNMEAPMHDPRAFWGMGLNYATGNRGACHVNTAGMYHEQGFCFFPQLGLEDESMPHTVEGKAFMTAQTQDLGQLANSLCMCHFPAVPWTEDDYVNVLNHATGFGYDLESLMRAGRRTWYLKRCINSLLGATRAHDTLPPRLLSPLEQGPTQGLVIEFAPMLAEWYELRGLDDQGRPRREVLDALDLGCAADLLHTPGQGAG